MSKRLIVLIGFLLILITLTLFNLFNQTKKEVIEENKRLFIIKEKINKIINLKNRYKLNQNLLRILKKYCYINPYKNKIIIKCINLDKNSFNLTQKIIFRNNFKIDKFSIFKTKEKTNLIVEISK